MRGLHELRLYCRRIVEESALPDAPMAMPEQSLNRPRMRIASLPLLNWIVWR